MRIFRSFQDLDAGSRGAVYAIGNFDGLHRGHRAVIETAGRIAQKKGVPCGVITFDPHPREYFSPSDITFRLTPVAPKMAMLKSWGVDLVVDVPFDATLARTSAEDFILVHLVGHLKVSHIVIGHDFGFGNKRQGNVSMLVDYGRTCGFGVEILDAQIADSGALFSSRAIRELLQSGRPREAAVLLGRWWAISGVVGHGEKRGRSLGYPTANLSLGDYMQPSLGIYAVWARDKRTGYWQKGAANLGVRPTFAGRVVLLEVYLLGFDGDLYGKTLDVSLVEYLRPEERFPDIQSLKHQMAEDCSKSDELLGLPDYAADRFSCS